MRRVVLAIVDFVVGDDLRVAVGVAILLGLTVAGARIGLDPWWLVAGAVPLLVWRSCVRARLRVRSDVYDDNG